MDPTKASGWLELFQSPLFGVAAGSFVLGGCVCVALYERYVVNPRVTQHMENCEARLAALQVQLDLQKEELAKMREIAERWNRITERAFLKGADVG